MITTDRIILRQWTEDDIPLFAEMSASTTVMRYYPSPLSAEEAEAHVRKWMGEIDNRGWGLWAAENRDSGEFMGLIGLQDRPTGLPFSPCVETGWRLREKFWGKGLATEGANAALAYGFTSLGLKEIVSFTSTVNTPSSSVMERLHMKRVLPNFDHPGVAGGHELEEHVLYKITDEEHRAYQQVEASGFSLPKGWIEAGSFGDSPKMADDLLDLVMNGPKRATTGLLWEYEHLNEALPSVGDHEIFTDSKANAGCVVEYNRVFTIAFEEVDEAYARAEGEGDLSLDHWRSVHWDFFTKVCNWIGREPSKDMPVVCTVFDVVHRV